MTAALYQNNFLPGLGATTTGAAAIPDYYFTKRTKAEVDAFIDQRYPRGYDFTTKVKCTSFDCAFANDMYREVERYNMYYVNGLIDYNKLLWAYSEARRGFEEYPRIPSFSESLKNMGTFLVSAIAGFAALGPVGIFVGGASASKAIMEQEKARRIAMANQKVNTIQQTTRIQQIFDQMPVEKLKTLVANPKVQFAGVVLVVGTAAYFLLKD